MLVLLPQETIAQESKEENDHVKKLFEKELVHRTPTRLVPCCNTISIDELKLNTVVFEYSNNSGVSTVNSDSTNRQSARVAQLDQTTPCVKKSLNGLSFKSAQRLGLVCFPRRDEISMRYIKNKTVSINLLVVLTLVMLFFSLLACSTGKRFSITGVARRFSVIF